MQPELPAVRLTSGVTPCSGFLMGGGGYLISQQGQGFEQATLVHYAGNRDVREGLKDFL